MQWTEKRRKKKTASRRNVRYIENRAGKVLGDLTGAGTTEKRALEESRVSREGEGIQRRRDSRKEPGLM